MSFRWCSVSGDMTHLSSRAAALSLFSSRAVFPQMEDRWFQDDSSALRKESSAVNTDETSLSGQPFTSCCMARWLRGHRLILVHHGLAVGDP